MTAPDARKQSVRSACGSRRVALLKAKRHQGLERRGKTTAANHVTPRLARRRPDGQGRTRGAGERQLPAASAGCLGRSWWPSTTAVARSISLRLLVREWSRSISNATASLTE
jgi:hypothetical protein